MRTIRRISLRINAAKWARLINLAGRYRDEKNAQLRPYHVNGTFAASASERTRRDELVSAGYASPNGLQDRMWKMAQKDAYETVEKQWAALREELSPLIQRHTAWSRSAKHYANWLVFTPQRMAELMSRRAPVPDTFKVSFQDRRRVRNYLRRVIRRERDRRPVARLARSMAFDADMYGVFEENGRQFIALMSLTPRRRIVVPLTGRTPIAGTIRVVLDCEKQRLAVHYTTAIQTPAPLTGDATGLDGGITEAFTDDQGRRYGTELEDRLVDDSDDLCDKGRKRNKLHQLAKKADQRGDHAKAARIRRNNLGTQKQRAHQRRQRAEIERVMNTAINQVVAVRQPAVIAQENLDLRGRAQSKRISRRVSLWARGILKDRMAFKASAKGFRRELVNPAYTSQTCPSCGAVHRGNRKGDRFKCLQCGYTDASDRVAAINLKARLSDPDIRRETPVARVKEILLARRAETTPAHARLERRGGRAARADPTVSGKTPGVVTTKTSRRAKRPPQSRAARQNVGAKSGQKPVYV